MLPERAGITGTDCQLLFPARTREVDRQRSGKVQQAHDRCWEALVQVISVSLTSLTDVLRVV